MRRRASTSASADACQQPCRWHVVNATLASRLSHVWGEGTSSCAADSKKCGAWDQNLMAEWHIRHGGRPGTIHWHVEGKSACIYLQLMRCSASEVASMIEDMLHHCTRKKVDEQYVNNRDSLREIAQLPSQVAFGRPFPFPHPAETHVGNPLRWVSSRALRRRKRRVPGPWRYLPVPPRAAFAITHPEFPNRNLMSTLPAALLACPMLTTTGAAGWPPTSTTS